MGLDSYFASQCQLILIGGLFPLNGRWWLATDVINYAGNAIHFIDNAIRHAT
jgi:hypothetical protein